MKIPGNLVVVDLVVVLLVVLLVVELKSNTVMHNFYNNINDLNCHMIDLTVLEMNPFLEYINVRENFLENFILDYINFGSYINDLDGYINCHQN